MSPTLIDSVEAAFEEHQFQVYYQPQYNHSTGMLVGAEALTRWIHPEEGLVPPVDFIGLFEANGLINRLDLMIFEDVCKFIRSCADEKIHLVPISVNLSRYDVYQEGFLENMELIRAFYRVPADALRIEITESVAASGKAEARAVVDWLHRYGYIVELDDFGTGYSSLSILKDIDYDVMKLDMSFLEDDPSGRGGTIVTSIVRMANWLKMPVIAEGVETIQQADFLKSVGCDYIQGYLYSRPIPQQDFRALLASTDTSSMSPMLELKSTINPVSFWSPDSLDTLIFSNFVGGAAIFRYSERDGAQMLRVNPKYIAEIGMNTTEKDMILSELIDTLEPESRTAYLEMLRRAIETGEEQECETWRRLESLCCGEERLCFRSNVSLIGHSGDEYLFYAVIRNITEEKRRLQENGSYEQKFRNIVEQANIYYWEYDIVTKDMHPCFRCMRDLGLPPVVHNYPEPAIAQSIIPADYADLYRDWHRRLTEGVEHLEAVIPLTVGRVPFHVRYTTEFDDFGHPYKAYGSAVLVTPEETSAE